MKMPKNDHPFQFAYTESDQVQACQTEINLSTPQENVNIISVDNAVYHIKTGEKR